MKKENFVEGSSVPKDALQELMNLVGGMQEDVAQIKSDMSTVETGLEAHKGSVSDHLLSGDRGKWDAAADKISELNFNEALAKIGAAKESAISAKNDAFSYKNSSETSENNAKDYAGAAEEFKNTAGLHVISAKNYAGLAECYASDAGRHEGNSRSYMNKASEYAGNSFNHAKRAEAAAKKAERFSGVSSGVVVDRVEDLPEDASVGCVCYVRTVTNAVLVTGKFSEFFVSEGWPSNVYSLSEELYSYMDYELDYTENGVVRFGAYVLNVDGTTVGDGGCFGCSIAVWNTTENLYGYDSGNPNAEVSFYLSNSNEVIYGEPFKGYSWNGSAWVELAMAENVGKIDEALDAILKMDADILGGDA